MTADVFDYVDVGRPVGVGPGSRIEWRPIGGYVNNAVEFSHGITPGAFSFELKDNHPLVDQIVNVKHRPFLYRAGYNGMEYGGRIMDRERPDAAPGRDRWVYSGQDHRYWLKRMYCWVNNLFPPEIQIGLTGKQNVKWGPPDSVFKRYVSEVATRLDKPIYSALPMRWPSSFTYTNLSDIDSLEDLIDAATSFTEALIVKQARFTQLDDLFQQEVDRLNIGITMDLWDNNGTTPPTVFNTSSLARLQSIINYTSDNFLDLSKLSGVSSLWSNTPGQACYVFNTTELRDNRKVQFRTDADAGIQSWSYKETHSDATRAIIGGKSPAIVNDLIEIGANLAIQLLINLLAPGLGLGVVVGDLFDDIFFAYQVAWDNDLENEIGKDHAYPEFFADNTAAWSLDGYSVGHTALKEHAGAEALTVTVASGVAGIGNSFGADNGTARRFRHGDTVALWDRGNLIDQFVSKVVVAHKRGTGESVEKVTLGDNKRLQGSYERLVSGLIGAGAGLRGLANST